MVRFEGNIEIGKRSVSNLLTQRTQEAFDGEIVELKLVPGRYGPFFHTSEKKFEGDCAVEEFEDYAKFSRVKKIKGIIETIPEKEICRLTELKLFLSVNEVRIDMDPDFSLLGPLQNFFHSQHHEKIEKIFYLTSRGRWVGLTKPSTFAEADTLYYLKHLRAKEKKYRHEIFLSIPPNIPGLFPAAFVGKTHLGTSIQFKLNNHAIDCVTEISKPFELPDK